MFGYTYHCIIGRCLTASVVLAFFLSTAYAQNTTSYWQQEVNYKIAVTLDDKQHELTGNLQFTYHNNSPNDLPFLYIHLWPNAYKNQSSAYGQQELRNGDTDFFYSATADRGFIDQLSFTAHGKNLVFELDPQNPDIGKLLLPQPLKSKDSLVITTPFHVKIPETYSRLGHIGESYQITQWYPKPAVYDPLGWHPMPYLDQGEFYSEYGSFDVSITLPQNYVVGATGDLQNTDEQAWLEQKVAQTDTIAAFDEKDLSFPTSAATTKTLRYIQTRVHDFAWFADKRFHVQKGEVILPHSGRKVTTWAMFTNKEGNLWKKYGIEAVNDGVYHYSKHLGDYPYRQCTAVESALSAGAGMEYPNITVIGESGTPLTLKTVIVHEVGHNWFYGQLGTNERDHAWMDEGMNSYYEERYLEEKFPDRKLGDMLGMEKGLLSKLINKTGLEYYTPADYRYIIYLLTARTRQDQPIDLHSNDYTSMNYGGVVYNKTAMAMRLLEKYIGTAEFDRIMQTYYREFEFKHPYPDDFRRIVERETGKSTDWFFDELIPTTKVVDYSIKKVKRNAQKIGNTDYAEVKLHNKFGNLRAPFTLSTVKDGNIVQTIPYDGFSGTAEVLLPEGDYDQIKIDAQQLLPELNRRNNTYKLKGMCKRPAPRLRFLGGMENPNRNELYWLPALGYNVYDGFMLGLGLHNMGMPAKRFQFSILPMYAFKSKGIAGQGQISYSWYPSQLFSSVKLGVSGKTYTHGNIIGTGDFDGIFGSERYYEAPFRYYKIAPALEMTFKPKALTDKVRHSITLQHVNILKSELDCPDSLYCSVTNSIMPQGYYVNQVKYRLVNQRSINPFGAQIEWQQSKYFQKLSAEATLKVSYTQKNKGITLRLFAGTFLSKADYLPYDFRYTLGSTIGKTDYLFDHTFTGRLETEGLWSAQIAPSSTDGGFKLRSKSGQLGSSQSWLTALNINADIPKVPISLYANLGYYPHPELFGITQDFLFDTGIALKLLPNIFEIYFPIAHSKDWKTALDNSYDNYWQRITFKLNLKLSGSDIMRRLSF